MERTLSSKEIAELVSLHDVTVRKKAKSGKIPAAKKGGQWVFNKEEVFEHLNMKVQKPVLLTKRALIRELKDKRSRTNFLNEFEFFDPSDVRLLLKHINDPEIDTAFNRLAKLRIHISTEKEMFS